MGNLLELVISKDSEIIKFSKGNTESEIQDAQRYIEEFHSGPLTPGMQEFWEIEKVELTNVEKEELQKQLEIAGDKLEKLGLSRELLPEADNVYFYYYIKGEDPEDIGGEATIETRCVHIFLSKYYKVTDFESKRVLFHEITHAITKRNIKWVASRDDYTPADTETVSFGFTRAAKGKYRYEKGLFEEGVSDIFSAFCLESDIESPYDVQTPFTIAFLKDLGEREGISEKEAFAQLFKAKVEQDYTFFKTLVDIYGTEFVRSMNNAKLILASASESELTELSKLGNFYDKYSDLQKAFDSGKPIALDGLTGSIHKANYKADRK